MRQLWVCFIFWTFYWQCTDLNLPEVPDLNEAIVSPRGDEGVLPVPVDDIDVPVMGILGCDHTSFWGGCSSIPYTYCSVHGAGGKHLVNKEQSSTCTCTNQEKISPKHKMKIKGSWRHAFTSNTDILVLLTTFMYTIHNFYLSILFIPINTSNKYACIKIF